MCVSILTLAQTYHHLKEIEQMCYLEVLLTLKSVALV